MFVLGESCGVRSHIVLKEGSTFAVNICSLFLEQCIVNSLDLCRVYFPCDYLVGGWELMMDDTNCVPPDNMAETFVGELQASTFVAHVCWMIINDVIF